MTNQIRPGAAQPVGATEIAARLGFGLDAVKRWRARHPEGSDTPFPAPRWIVGGRPAWDWNLDIAPWLTATGRDLDENEAGWRRFFRLRDLGGDKVLLESLGPDDDWVPLATFVGDQDGGWQAFASQQLREEFSGQTERADLIAWQHLQRWDRMKARWGKLHPGEPLPTHLVPQRSGRYGRD